MNTIRNSVILGLHLLATASATPTRIAKHCVDIEVPVSISASNYLIDAPRVNSNHDVVEWVRNLTTWSSPSDRIVDRLPVDGTFTISGQLCVPAHGEKKDILQIATHGIAFNKKYWDVQIEPEHHSYVDAAIREGYSIFIYDRLGTGQSQKPDGNNIVQAPVEVEILKELTILAREGDLVKSARVLRGDIAACTFTPRKVVHVGHSFGSILTSGFLGLHGQLSDGAILTGFIVNDQVRTIGVDSKGFTYAAESDPRFRDRTSGYIVQNSKSIIQLAFFGKDTFEERFLDYALGIIDTSTTMESMTAPLVVEDNVATQFRGPIQFFLAEFDFPVCAGDCKDTYHMEDLESQFPSASNISVYIQPHTGHGFTLQKNATAGYQVMFSYLDEFDL